MIEYYQIGGQLYANVLPSRDRVSGFIWYVTWGFGLVRLAIFNRHHVPDDIQ